MYKLIALDMDGTLLNEKKEITPRTREAIKAATKAGIRVVLASGRPPQGLFPHLEGLGLNTPDEFVISYNGSLVQRVGSNEVLHQTALCGKDAKTLLSHAQQNGVYIHAFCPELGLITHQNNPWTTHEGTLNQMEINEHDFTRLDNSHSLIKIMLVGEESQLDLAREKLPKEFDEQYTIVRSTPFFLEFMHKESNKGVGVAKLAEALNLSPAEVMCAGDAENDRHMLEYAGMAVAMGNASPAIKAIAHFVAPSNDEDGVAVAIEQHALKA